MPAQIARRRSLPAQSSISHLHLMHPILRRAPFTAAGWVFENKLDGYRVLACKTDRQATSSTGRSITMSRLLDDLLEVSRITRGKLELRKERIDLNESLAATVETARPLIEARGHHLMVKLPAEHIEADADPVRFAQIFSNLLKYVDPASAFAASDPPNSHFCCDRWSSAECAYRAKVKQFRTRAIRCFYPNVIEACDAR